MDRLVLGEALRLVRRRQGAVRVLTAEGRFCRQ